MSSIATLNGVQYIIPAYNDTGWAQGAGNLSLYLAAIAANTFQPTGGAFTLTAEADFGASFGLKALYIKTETANPASAGVIRLASADTVKWRNNANAADISLSKDASDNLQWNATKVLLSGAVVNADINASAAIAYSKLTLTGSVVNADIGAAAAIAYSKLALSASIVNADVAAAAAIAVNKLAALTVSRAMVTDASGFASAATVTATELGYVSGVTSAIQTQLNATIKNPALASISFSPTTLGIVGTTSANDTVAGNVGEYVESIFSGVSYTTTNTYKDMASISLTAGDWNVDVKISITGVAGTSLTDWVFGASTTSGNSGTGLTNGNSAEVQPVAAIVGVNTQQGMISNIRFSLGATTTVYLKGFATFTSTAPSGSGRLSARRIR